MSFWIIAVTGAALVTLMLMRAVRRGVPSTTDGQVDQGLKVYRDQLAEVERDVSRGVLSASDAARGSEPRFRVGYWRQIRRKTQR